MFNLDGQKKTEEVPVGATVDFQKVVEWKKYFQTRVEGREEMESLCKEAKNFLEYYDWCGEILETYMGMLYLGVVGVFLFKIAPTKKDVDEWIWVIVGDLPSAYLTVDECPNPATALDGYVGAMEEWVEAAQSGDSVAGLIPVNVAATKENAKNLKIRLSLLEKNILSEYKEDLKA
jgi:hypothetical protein